MNAYVTEHLSRWNLYFDLERSQRYHRKRQGFFENMHIALTWLSICAGSGAYLSINKTLPLQWAQYLALSVAGLGILSLVLRPSERARKYADLHDKFADLMKRVLVPKKMSDAELFEITTARLDLEKTEPKHSRALNAVCYNETAQALGVAPHPTTWFTRTFAHVMP